FVMSDSEDSKVTYKEVSSPFKDLSFIRSPRVDGLPMMLEDPYVEAALQAPPSPDYVPCPEHPPLPVYVPYVPELIYPEFMPPKDDVLPAEKQPLLVAVSPTADSPGYITESDHEEDPKEDDEDLRRIQLIISLTEMMDLRESMDCPMMLEDPYVEASLQAPPSPDYVPGPEHLPLPVYVPYVPEPVYPEFMPSKDDMLPAEEQPMPTAVSPTADSQVTLLRVPHGNDVNDEEEDEDEDEEEHPASIDSVPPPVHRVTARMSVLAQTPISLPLDTEVARLLAIHTLPPSPLSPFPTYPLGYQAAMIRLRAESPSTSHPLPLPSLILLPHTRASVAMMRAVAPSTYILAPRSGILPSETPPSGTPPLLHISLPTLSPPLLLLSIDCRAGVSEVTLPHRKRLCIALGLRFKVGESSSAPTATKGFRADYRIVGTLDDEIRRDPEREDTNEIYRRLDDAHDDSSLMSGQLNMLRKDRRAHAHTARLMETEAKLSHEAWVQSMDASDITRSEVRALRTTVLAQQTEIEELRAADRKRQTQLTEALTLMRTLQTQVTALQSQQGPTSSPARPEIPEEAGSSSKWHQKTTRLTPATITTPTTFVTDEKLKRLIDQGVADALAARDADKSQNGKDNHDSGTGVRRQAPPARECTYLDFMKCQPLYFKGTEGVVELT
ncbi:hypothetical protein Tco_0555399, partial [Tanacetum coccineum]